MPNPQMPNIPGAAVMNDTLDFVKNLWGSMSVPGLTAPTLSVDELDKKINDLKAVEAWLTLNMSMLRGSIQALEVQRGTIATLKSVGASLAAAVNTGANDKSLFDSHPYASAFFQHAAPATVKTAATAAPAAPAAPAKPAEEAKPASKAADDMAQMANPAMWWNLLQEQFKQAVATAMAPETMSSAAAAATDAAVKFAAAATSQASEAAAAMSKPAPAKASDDKAPNRVQENAQNKPAASKAPAKRAAAKPAKDE